MEPTNQYQVREMIREAIDASEARLAGQIKTLTDEQAALSLTLHRWEQSARVVQWVAISVTAIVTMATHAYDWVTSHTK